MLMPTISNNDLQVPLEKKKLSNKEKKIFTNTKLMTKHKIKIDEQKNTLTIVPQAGYTWKDISESLFRELQFSNIIPKDINVNQYCQDRFNTYQSCSLGLIGLLEISLDKK
jgi:hypothetical protein